ncbi:hypothetical protein [uncultured Hymenobacter sp.]
MFAILLLMGNIGAAELLKLQQLLEQDVLTPAELEEQKRRLRR